MTETLIKLLPICSAIGTLVAAVWALFQWRRSILVNSAEMAERLLNRYSEDDVQEFFSIVDHESERWYEERFESDDAQNIEFERKADSALLFFDHLCYLYLIGTISENEISFFSYQINKLLLNEQTMRYFNSMRSWYKVVPFINLIRFGAFKGIDKSPYNEIKVSWKIRRYFSWMPIFSDKNESTASFNTESKEKISELVRGDFLKAIYRVGVCDAILKNLCSIDYSRLTFGIPYAVLIRQEDMSEKLDRRYYAFPIRINNETYRLCNHWYERNRKKIELWLAANHKER